MGGVNINKPPIFYTRIVYIYVIVAACPNFGLPLHISWIVYIYVIVAEVYPTELLSRKIFLMFI